VGAVETERLEFLLVAEDTHALREFLNLRDRPRELLRPPGPLVPNLGGECVALARELGLLRLEVSNGPEARLEPRDLAASIEVLLQDDAQAARKHERDQIAHGHSLEWGSSASG